MAKEKGQLSRQDDHILLFDFFGLFVTDPYKRFFLEQLGPDYVATKDRFCAPGDRGDISYDQFLDNIGEFFHMNPESIRQQAKSKVVYHPEMLDLARRCKAIRPTYLLSNCMEGMIEEYLPREEVASCFDRLFLSNEMHLIKPTEACFRFVMDAHHLAPEQIYFYDDNPRNVDEASRLGIRATLFVDAKTCEEDLKRKGLL